MTQERVRELLAKAGAIIEGHFVGTSGNHMSVYVAKDRATRLTSVVAELCIGIAELFYTDEIEAVVAPATGGIPLSQWTAHHLNRLNFNRPEVLALYSEYDETPIDSKNISFPMLEGEKAFVRSSEFVLRRGFAQDVRGKRVLEVEDILTTGGSARKTAEAIIAAGGKLVGLGVLANGGNVKAVDCSAPRLEALMTVERQMFTEAECADHGLCARGVPINTDFGHGKTFLAKQKR